ncbi:hypothetical protein BT96DRAFT_1059850 [Gymnopus androsaceus JB14]|uniref:Uncharacterized protein n=1 Tax=Gymnopus androsaceus JB14 TaxID=1447944 RepID=A0A6A4H204_9AGAR|nr:hypothetical protein BT96DRAFT_1059850 [Gymnopus androsaceus JB14]
MHGFLPQTRSKYTTAVGPSLGLLPTGLSVLICNTSMFTMASSYSRFLNGIKVACLFSWSCKLLTKLIDLKKQW